MTRAPDYWDNRNNLIDNPGRNVSNSNQTGLKFIVVCAGLNFEGEARNKPRGAGIRGCVPKECQIKD